MISTVDDSVAEVLEAMTGLMALSDGWNGYSAPSPSLIAVENAKSFMVIASEARLVPTSVEPSAMGGVGVTFFRHPREVAIEFYNNETAHVLLTDDTTSQMDTHPVRTEESGYRELVEEVQNYFGAKPRVAHAS